MSDAVVATSAFWDHIVSASLAICHPLPAYPLFRLHL